MITDPPNDLLDRTYHSKLQRAVVRAINGGAATLTDLCRNCAGAFPTVVLEVGREIVGNQIDDWPRRLWPEESLGTEDGAVPSMPEPHPVDFEWRYTAGTAEALATILGTSGGRIGCFGTPSVFVRLIHQGADAVLVDRNPALPRHFSHILHNRIRTVDLSLPLAAASRQPSGHDTAFDTILLDPPWYASHMLAWLAQALSTLRQGGRVILTMFPELVRPSAHSEREQLLHVLRSLGNVKQIDVLPRYTTPLFESETLSAFGLADLGQWRVGELFEVTVRDPRYHAFDHPVIDQPKWERIQLGRQVIAVRHDPVTRHMPISVSPVGPTGSFLLRSVSARDPFRDHVTVWTSRNRAAQVAGTDTASRFLASLASGAAPNTLLKTDPTFAEARHSLVTLLALVGW